MSLQQFAEFCELNNFFSIQQQKEFALGVSKVIPENFFESKIKNLVEVYENWITIKKNLKMRFVYSKKYLTHYQDII